MSKEMGAGGRFDIFLDSAQNPNLCQQKSSCFSITSQGMKSGLLNKSSRLSSILLLVRCSISDRPIEFISVTPRK